MMAEEEGIWDKKPEPVWVPRGYYSKSKIKEDDAQIFHLDAMDPWLEKVKERLDDLKTDCDGFQKLASESTLRGAANRKKLEAIETWLKNAKAQGRISMSDGMKLDKILGDS